MLCQISARNRDLDKDGAWAIAKNVHMPSDAPPETSDKPSMLSTDDPTKTAVISIRTSMFDAVNGEIQRYAIIVASSNTQDLPSFGKLDNYKALNTWYKSMIADGNSDQIEPYQTTPNIWNPFNTSATAGSRSKRSAREEEVSYTIGSVDCSDKSDVYCNGPLRPGTSYRIKIRGFTTSGYRDSVSIMYNTEPDHTVTIVTVSVVVSLLLVLCIVVILVLAYRKMLPWQRKEEPPHPMTLIPDLNPEDRGILEGELIPKPREIKNIIKSRPVKLIDFHQHVVEMIADSDLKFAEEYAELKMVSPSFNCEAAELEGNKNKNRYVNILPFESSRVKLLPIDDDECSDYINASYIPGYNTPREFIAAQGPLTSSIDDFWRMVWEQNVSVIVMVTQCVERGRKKCEQYWPHEPEEPVYYGSLRIQLTSETVLSEYTIRVLSIAFGEHERIIKQFNFTTWPDFGCPETSASLISFVDVVRTHVRPNMVGPILIHCSAGVGRTGTFIAVDYLLQHVLDHDYMDVFGLVLEMRKHRCNMVQTEDQYIYIHECLRDALEDKRLQQKQSYPIVMSEVYKTDDEKLEVLHKSDSFQMQSLAASKSSQQSLAHIGPAGLYASSATGSETEGDDSCYEGYYQPASKTYNTNTHATNHTKRMANTEL